MIGMKLLENNPLSATLIRAWFLEKMIESLQTTDVPDEFKDMMRETGIENDKLSVMIDANPRMLLDVFDENDIYINIEAYLGELTLFDSFGYGILGQKLLIANMEFKTRKEAELFAIEKAFEILEKQLTPKEENNEN
jgi:hypothetical protein